MVHLNRGGAARVSPWTSVFAPAIGSLGGVAVLGAIVVNAGSLLGTPPGSLRPLLLPAIVIGAAAGGGLWAGWLRRNRLDVYNGIGRSRPNVYDVPDDIGLRF